MMRRAVAVHIGSVAARAHHLLLPASAESSFGRVTQEHGVLPCDTFCILTLPIAPQEAVENKFPAARPGLVRRVCLIHKSLSGSLFGGPRQDAYSICQDRAHFARKQAVKCDIAGYSVNVWKILLETPSSRTPRSTIAS